MLPTNTPRPTAEKEQPRKAQMPHDEMIEPDVADASGAGTASRFRSRSGMSFKRLETPMSDEDFAKLVHLKEVTGSTTLANVVRLALRTFFVLATHVQSGHDVYLVKRNNPRDKTRVKLF
jgi:hypothetical protein